MTFGSGASSGDPKSRRSDKSTSVSFRFEHDIDVVGDVSSPSAGPVLPAAAVRPSHSFVDAAKQEVGAEKGLSSTPPTPPDTKGDGGGGLLSPGASFIDSTDAAAGANGSLSDDGSTPKKPSRRRNGPVHSSGPSEHSEDDKESQAGLVDALKTLLAELSVEDRIVFGTGHERQKVDGTPYRTRVEVLQGVSDEHFARRLQQEEDAEADARERAGFEFAQSLTEEADGHDENDDSASGYGIDKGLTFPKLPVPPFSVSRMSDARVLQSSANRFAVLAAAGEGDAG